MIRRSSRSTPLYSSAASDVYKRQPLPRRALPLAAERELSGENLEERGLRGPHQRDSLGGARNRDARRGAHGEPFLSVQGQEYVRGVVLHREFEPDRIGEHEGSKRQRVRADRREHERRQRGFEDGAARRKVVGGGPGRRGHDEPVSPVPRHQAAVHVDADRGDARERRLGENGVVDDAIAARGARAVHHPDRQQAPPLDVRRPRKRRLEHRARFARPAGREKPQRADVDSEHGNPWGRMAGYREQRSVAPKGHDEIDEARDLRARDPAGNAAGARRLEVVDDRDSPPHEQTLELACEGDRGRAAVAGHETHAPYTAASGLRGLHPRSVAGFRRNAARSSTFPSAPVIGDGITPRLARPSDAAAAVTRATARARTPSSRTIPPRPTSVRSASNWGFTRRRASAPSARSGTAAGRIREREMNDTSATSKEGGSGTSARERNRAFTFSRTTTRGSFLRRAWS